MSNTVGVVGRLIGRCFILGLLLISCQNPDPYPLIELDLVQKDKAEYQKTIVGQLSGEIPLSDKSVIKNRWSGEERAATARYLRALIQTLNLEPQQHHFTVANLNPAINFIFNPYKGTNIFGILPATRESNEYIVLGAHYDSGKRNAPGAIDNATGIALIYSVIRELKQLGQRNKNVIFVFFDQEEEELIGSKTFAKFLTEKSWDIHSVHCFDMVGWDSDGDKAMEIFSASEELREIYRSAAKTKNIPLNEIIIDPVDYDRNSTDFDAFVPLGFNVIGAGECFYFRDSTPYKDTPDDTYDTVNFSYLLSCSDLIEEIISTLVNSK